MKGWEFTDTHQPLRLVEKPDPEVKPGYVLLKTKAAGLCHSDVSALELDSWRHMFTAPLILGHEVCGEILELGEGVEGWEVGDIVAVCPVESNDGTMGGYNRDGGFATLTTAPQEQLIKVPEGLSYEKAALATDAGMTAYNALCVPGEMQPGMKVGIIGVGGLGQIAVRVAVLKGCEVYVATRKKEAQELALGMGAAAVANSILDFKDVGLDLIVDYAGAGQTTADAIDAVGFRGTVVLVGMSEDFANITTMNLILKGVTLKGSLAAGKTKTSAVDQIKELLGMLAAGELDPAIETIGFEEIGEGMDRLAKGQVTGRLIALFD